MKLLRARIYSGVIILFVLIVVGATNAAQSSSVAFAQHALTSQFAPILLPASGILTVPIEQSLTVDQLRGKAIDQAPPKKLFEESYAFPHNTRTNGSYTPYMASNIAPFQFDHFTVEWNYGGYHTREMRDYALLHGFDLAYLYRQSASEVPVAPSEYLQWTGMNWNRWMADNGYEHQRWDQLPQRQAMVDEILAEEKFAHIEGHKHLMIDMEYPSVPMNTAELRAQDWYPSATPDLEFEQQYYDGFVKTQLVAAEAAHEQGWEKVGFYGWSPFRRQWWGLENAAVNADEDWSWNAYGKSIYNAELLDVIYPSVYSFYWSDQNVAYTLANTDLNLQYVNSEETQKPVRPYFWNALHGGGTGWRWWRNLPMRNEDAAAMFAMNFFTGADGLVLWSWSGTANPNMVEIDVIDCDLDCGIDSGSYATQGNYSVKDSFAVVATDTDAWGSEPMQFEQYDAIVVIAVDIDSSMAYFQRVDKTNKDDLYGIDLGWQTGQPATHPVYAMDTAALASLLRATTEPVASMIEGLALVKPFERLLREGEPKVDVLAQTQFGETLPIVRRVEYEDYQIVITYDPQWQLHDEPRTIYLEDFNGNGGLDVVLPADQHPRIFVLQHVPEYQVRSLVSGSLTIHGEPAAVGTEIEMRSERGERVGSTIVSDDGYFAPTYIFGTKTGASILGTGMREGEVVRFFVDGVEAKPLINYYWSNDWLSAEHDVQLFVGATATNIDLASMSIETQSNTTLIVLTLMLALGTAYSLKKDTVFAGR